MNRRDYDKKVLGTMLRLYCRNRHQSSELCDECRSLCAYCFERIDHCPQGDRKTTCRKCTIHCYNSQKREQIREVMKYSGPRLLLYHPIMAIRHLLKEMF